MDKIAWIKKQNVIERDIDGEKVLLDLKTGVYYSLNETGSHVWQLLEKPSTIVEIIDEILMVYDDTQDSAKRKINELLEDLCNENLIEKAENNK